MSFSIAFASFLHIFFSSLRFITFCLILFCMHFCEFHSVFPGCFFVFHFFLFVCVCMLFNIIIHTLPFLRFSFHMNLNLRKKISDFDDDRNGNEKKWLKNEKKKTAKKTKRDRNNINHFMRNHTKILRWLHRFDHRSTEAFLRYFFSISPVFILQMHGRSRN